MATKSVLPLAFLAAVALGARADAITWCHDYTAYRVTEGQTAPDGMGPDTLEALLKSEHYRPFPVSRAYEDPEFGRHLKPGDVILLGTEHSGYVYLVKDESFEKAGEDDAEVEDEEAKDEPAPCPAGSVVIAHYIQHPDVKQRGPRPVDRLPAGPIYGTEQADGRRAVGGLFTCDTWEAFLQRRSSPVKPKLVIWRKE